MRLKTFIIEKIESDEESLYHIIDVLYDECSDFLKSVRKSRGFLYRGYNGNVKTISSIKPRTDRSPKDTPHEIHEMLNEFFYKYFHWDCRSEGAFATGSKSIAADYGNDFFLFFPVDGFKFVWHDRIHDLYSEIDSSGYKIEPDEGDFSYNWEATYGEDCEGHWEWYGEEIVDIDTIVGDTIDAMINAGEVNSDDDIDNARDKLIDEIEREKIWIPDIEEDVYVEDKINEWLYERREYFDNIVNEYDDKNLDDAMKSGNEIMIKCKKYYLVNINYERALEDLFKWKTKPPANKQYELFRKKWKSRR